MFWFLFFWKFRLPIRLHNGRWNISKMLCKTSRQSGRPECSWRKIANLNESEVKFAAKVVSESPVIVVDAEIGRADFADAQFLLLVRAGRHRVSVLLLGQSFLLADFLNLQMNYRWWLPFFCMLWYVIIFIMTYDVIIWRGYDYVLWLRPAVDLRFRSARLVNKYCKVCMEIWNSESGLDGT